MAGVRRRGEMEKLKINVPVELMRDFNLLVLDPTKNEPAYGYRSLIITEILQEWVDKAKQRRDELLNQDVAA